MSDSTNIMHEAEDIPEPQKKPPETKSNIWEQLSDSGILIQSGLVTVYLASLLFVTGWAYADRYFALLGISISSVERNLEGAYYIYAIWALRDGWAFIIASIISIGIIAFLLHLFKRWGRLWCTQSIFLIAIVVIFSFLGAFELGQYRANTQVLDLLSKNYQNFPRLIIYPKKNSATANFLKSKTTQEKNTCLRKVFQDQKTLYVYPGYESFLGTIPPVYAIPMDQIAAIEIIRNKGLCKP